MLANDLYKHKNATFKNKRISILEKLVLLLFLPIPIFMLFLGTQGIIENNSPSNLASLSSLGKSFVDFFSYNSLIIFGAMGFTFIVWLATRRLW